MHLYSLIRPLDSIENLTATSPSTLAPVSTSLMSFDGTIVSTFQHARPSSAGHDRNVNRRSASCGDESENTSTSQCRQERRNQQSQLTAKGVSRQGSTVSPSSQVIKSVFVQEVGWASQVRYSVCQSLFQKQKQLTTYRDLSMQLGFFAGNPHIDELHHNSRKIYGIVEKSFLVENRQSWAYHSLSQSRELCFYMHWNAVESLCRIATCIHWIRLFCSTDLAYIFKLRFVCKWRSVSTTKRLLQQYLSKTCLFGCDKTIMCT